MSNALSQVVNVTFLLSNPQVSTTNFGTPLLMVCKVPSGFVGLVNSYASAAELESAGFNACHPAVLMAESIFAQNPSPSNIMVGARTFNPTQIIDLSPVNTNQGFVYSFSIVSSAAANPSTQTTTPITYTVPGSATTTTIATAIEGLIATAAPPGVTPTNPSAGLIVLTSATPGVFFDLIGLPLPQNMTVFDNTADAGSGTSTAGDLDNVVAVNADAWYSVHYDHASSAQILGSGGIAKHVEALQKICVLNTSDTICVSQSPAADTTSVAHVLQAETIGRTSLLYSANALLPYSAGAWTGEMLSTTPGAANWAFKSIAGSLPDTLNSGYAANAKAKNLNTYQTLGGRNVTLWGTTPSGWLDIEVGIDWLVATIQSACWSVTVANQKIAYTDSGMLSYKAAVMGVLAQAVQNGLVAPGFTVTVAPVASVSSATRATRSSPQIKFNCTFQGAVNQVNVSGTGGF